MKTREYFSIQWCLYYYRWGDQVM